MTFSLFMRIVIFLICLYLLVTAVYRAYTNDTYVSWEAYPQEDMECHKRMGYGWWCYEVKEDNE